MGEEQKKGSSLHALRQLAPRIWQRGVKPLAANGFLLLSYKKTVILAHFFYRKKGVQ